MKRLLVLALALFGAHGAVADPAPASAALAASPDVVARGRYLATVADCVACHTAKGGRAFAGGLPVETPFGVIVSPNLTPDPDTGIGGWTDAQFYRAMTRGIDDQGAHLYPAFPYPYFTKGTSDDIAAIHAYLNSLPPVSHEVVSNRLPFPFNIRASLIGWNMLFFTPGHFQPHSDKSAEWNRGAYIVEGFAHCGACHTAKNLLGGDRTALAYQGAVIRRWTAPGITADPYLGIGVWTVDDLVRYLKTGHNAYAAASGPMAEVVSNSTTYMHDDDLRAVAVFLKDVGAPERTRPAPMAADAPSMLAGHAIYRDNCAACHGKDGKGVANLFPSLADSPAVQSPNVATVARVVLQGVRSVGTDPAPTAPAMPTYAWKLDDAEIASVLTYIRNAWGNTAAPVSTDQAASFRNTLAKHPG